MKKLSNKITYLPPDTIDLKCGASSFIENTDVGRLEINMFIVAIDGKPTKYLKYCKDACKHMTEKWDTE